MASQSEAHPRPFPLGLQYIYTTLACASFARAMLAHPAAGGAQLADIATRDPSRLRGVEDRSYIHSALLLADGSLLDAEGVRTFDALCADFGIDPDLSSIEPSRDAEPDVISRGGHLIRQIADLCGWRVKLPAASDGGTASESWEAAEEEFWDRGGMNMSPEDMLEAYYEDLASGAYGANERSVPVF